MLSIRRHDSRSVLSISSFADVPILALTVFIQVLETEPCGQLNLPPGADRAEYAAYVVGEVTRCICEDSVSISSQCKRVLRVTRDREIRVVEQIVSFHSKHKFRALRQLKILLQCQIE